MTVGVCAVTIKGLSSTIAVLGHGDYEVHPRDAALEMANRCIHPCFGRYEQRGEAMGMPIMVRWASATLLLVLGGPKREGGD